MTRADLALSTDSQARFDVMFTASEPGRRKVEAEASFVLCQESACRPVREKVALEVETTAPAPAPRKSPARAKVKAKP